MKAGSRKSKFPSWEHGTLPKSIESKEIHAGTTGIEIDRMVLKGNRLGWQGEQGDDRSIVTCHKWVV